MDSERGGVRMKKIVIINDVNTVGNDSISRFQNLAEEYGYGTEVVDDLCSDSMEEFSKWFLKMAQEGPDAVPLNEKLIEAIKDAEIVITAMSAIPTKAINGAKALKAVCIMRSGVENINLSNATQKRVKVINAPGRLAVPVSEFTVGLMIAEMKNIARSNMRVLDHDFSDDDFCNTNYTVNLKGKNVGIIGCGAIGARVAKIMKAFEANVLVYDPFCDSKNLESQGYTVMELNELCKEADVISMHFRLTPETKGLLGKEQFALMKPTAVLINTARAGLVDEEAMMDALINHKIGGAGLDVWHQEPLPENHPFYTMDNVTLTGHLAGWSSNAFEMTVDIMIQALKHYFETGEWVNVVNKEVL